MALRSRTLRFTLVAGLLAAGIASQVQALPVFESGRSARILDEATGRPIANIFFVIEQSHRSPGLGHGSAHDCVRSAAVISRGTQAELRLPSSDIPAINRLGGETGERSFAHTPGYCTLPRWKDAGGTSTYQARRNTDAPEQRIWYLASIAMTVPGGCGKGEAADFERTRNAIVAEIRAEAHAVATNPYERYLAENVGKFMRGAPPSEPPSLSGRGFAIVDDSRRPTPINWSHGNTTCRHCSRIEGITVGAPGAPLTAPAPPRYRVVCRDPAACDLDRRNSTGRTYLAELLEEADTERVAVLLAAGADPEIQRYPGGSTGLDALLGAAGQKTDGMLDRARDIVKALVADGRATVRPTSRQHWATLAQNAAATETQARRAEIAALLGQLRDRPPFAPTCPLNGHGKNLLPLR